MSNIEWFANIGISDVDHVGGKNASLGEMYNNLAERGVRVPNGFATTAAAFGRFLHHNDLDTLIETQLNSWQRGDVEDLERRSRLIRQAILAGSVPDDLRRDVTGGYQQLSVEAGIDDVYCAVRSSATAEDLPEASFAGQQETYLMVHGAADVLDSIRRCFASLYTARAISYRHDMGINQHEVALSACVQRMVRSDLACSGVIFTLDTDSGHPGMVYLTGVWGLGENIVQGRVIPDAYLLHKATLTAGFSPIVAKTVGAKELTMSFDGSSNRIVNTPTAPALRKELCLDDEEVLTLARWAVVVEEHYTMKRGVATPMDLEWAKDGVTGELFIVQARPETVHSQRSVDTVKIYTLTGSAESLVTGLAVGEHIATGPIRRIESPEDMNQLGWGDVLVTEITDPDWEPILKRAAALVTERGGRTSHTAIVARELGIPAIVGTGPIHEMLANDQVVTVSCAEGETGVVYNGEVAFETTDIDVLTLPETGTDILLNVGNPGEALKHSLLPSSGVGLARMEFIFASHVGIHPLALTRRDQLPVAVRREVDAAISSYREPTEFLVDRLSQGIGTIAAAFWPRPVILRFSDFKTNEYAGLLGGRQFEPTEANPMLGWRGASRYYHPDYRDGFELEVAAVLRVRNVFGLTNLKVMVPFCRTPAEGRAVLEVMSDCGLAHGSQDLEVYVMAEIPANVLQADAFAEVFDGFSIGSNDLTQLTLGVDRDSAAVAHLFDERDVAVKRACSMVIRAAKEAGKKIGICGQAPSDYPDFAAFLVGEGIDSISVTPDALPRTIKRVAEAELALGAG